MRNKNIKSICVFCGSRDGSNSKFREVAIELGHLMAKKNISLVYGGRNIGLMGALASSAQTQNCDILGVIPHHLMKKEVGKTNLKNLKVTENMHDRKNLMYKSADAFLVLPGGVGTLDEFFEILTWAQLSLHKKPIILLDIENFWLPLCNLIKHQIKFGFINKSINDLFHIFRTPEEAISYLLDSNRTPSPK